MRLIRGLQNIPSDLKHCVATIGNFDGIHCGHQFILQQLYELSQKKHTSSVVMVFEPQPEEYFGKKNKKIRITSIIDKYIELQPQKIDYLLCLRFDRELSQLTAKAFVKKVLVDQLRIRSLVIGDDFRFGCDRQGRFELLKKLGVDYGYDVEKANSFQVAGERVSSTTIRKLLTEAKFQQVSRLLGHPYRMSGQVIYGQKLARQWSMPTANLVIKNPDTFALLGVFAVKIRLSVNSTYEGVANVGKKPTLCDNSALLLEAHLFGFSGHLYGQRLQIEFHHKIRDEKKFDHVEALQKRIKQDVQEAQLFFRSRSLL